MQVLIELIQGPITATAPLFDRHNGALVEFYGVVRELEQGSPIQGLDYEAYEPMAKRVLAKLIHQLAPECPVFEVILRHSLGRVPVGMASLYLIARATHRNEALEMVSRLIEGLKREVPIWKKAY